ncbi:hypothetical protein PIROE2DRAFT_12896 [Piromyces sp. E2]|nr:hypothetical protein PIROE2DRAFT_12896 [Piromyces sp. E2]|eukprot:OUM61177.1 hypothetical protein PIROE2DRAFT_12896 [Piromyces sp. E2]
MNSKSVFDKPNYYNVGLYVIINKNEKKDVNESTTSKSLDSQLMNKTELQKKILFLYKFCRSHKLFVSKCYIDIVDNYNVLLENRKSLNSIIGDLETEKINCIITDTYSNFFEGNTPTKFNKIFFHCFNPKRNSYDENSKCFRKRFIVLNDNIDTEKKINKYNIKLHNKPKKSSSNISISNVSNIEAFENKIYSDVTQIDLSVENKENVHKEIHNSSETITNHNSLNEKNIQNYVIDNKEVTDTLNNNSPNSNSLRDISPNIIQESIENNNNSNSNNSSNNMDINMSVTSDIDENIEKVNKKKDDKLSEIKEGKEVG